MLTTETKQTPRRSPTATPNGTYVLLGGRLVPCKDYELNGKVYSVPVGVTRGPKTNAPGWTVTILGKSIRFYENRYNPDPAVSLADAIAYLGRNRNVASKKDLETVPYAEPITKNVSYGIAGISSHWKHKKGQFYFSIIVQKTMAEFPVKYALAIMEKDFNEVWLAAALKKLVYMLFVMDTHPEMLKEVLDGIWESVKMGTIEPVLEFYVDEQLLAQVKDNLACRKEKIAGNGWLDPHTNELVY